MSVQPSTAEIMPLSQFDQDTLLRHRALHQARRGEYREAIELFDLLLDRQPTSASDFNNRGLLHFQLGDLEAALADYDQALALNPKLAKVYNNRANCYVALGDMAAAIGDYEVAIDLNPTDLRARINQGITFRDLGYYREAIDAFDTALDLCNLLAMMDSSETVNLHEGHIYAERGRAWHLAGDWNCALVDYQRALERLPMSSMAHRFSAKLRHQVLMWADELLAPLSA